MMLPPFPPEIRKRPQEFVDLKNMPVRNCSFLLAISLVLPCVTLCAAEADFVTAVTSTRPIGYYRLNKTTGKSEVGATQYSPMGGVTADAPGPFGGNSKAATLNGRDGYIVTTQTGGVAGAASIMAWVNLDALPSTERRYFYVAGESQNGNDLDLQFENDDVLKFYTAAGGHASFTPPPATLLHQWHMIVATLDTPTQTRVIYWDGKAVTTDKGGGSPNKSGVFSIGESTVFHGRFLKGGVAEVALWNRALRANEVAAIYAAINGAPAVGSAAPAAGASLFPNTAKISVADAKGPIQLNREEQVAFLFMSAFEIIEMDCQSRAQHSCTLEQMLAGVTAPDGTRLSHLKFDPRTDPNYTYTVAARGMAWEAHATAKKPGLIGFYFWARSWPGSRTAVYNPSGTAVLVDTELGNTSVEGDSFVTQ